MEIELTKGPLAESLLQAIADTYGSHDKKYRSISFCRTVFNENPSGYSFHAFAKAGEKNVGHYAVIPVEISARGRKELSGKGEALFLEKEYRSESVRAGDKDVPLGIGLAARLYDFVLQQGTAVIHVIADSRVGVIHQMAGCTKRVVEQTKFVFILDRNVLRRSDSSAVRVWGSSLVFLLQHILLGFFRLVSLFSRGSIVVHGQHVDGSEAFLESMSKVDDEQAGLGTWTIAKNEANLLWFFRTGLLEVVSTDRFPQEFIVVRRTPKPGSDAEIVDFRVGPGIRFPAIKALCCAIERAKKEKAGRIVWYASLSKERGSGLRPFMKLLGFISKIEKRPIYLRSNDQFFLEAQNITFTPFFYSTF